ncbi:MAG: hypothetical protein IEMM0006_0018 [bacterium]|nr:MAG: hypothetical protein IEMM0006_0018 [bacterium]
MTFGVLFCLNIIQTFFKLSRKVQLYYRQDFPACNRSPGEVPHPVKQQNPRKTEVFVARPGFPDIGCRLIGTGFSPC